MKLIKIKDSKNFWYLYDMVNGDTKIDRKLLLSSYKSGYLYGIKKENQIIPCLCIRNNHYVLFIWVHTNYRNQGIGRYLLKSLNIKYVYIRDIFNITFFSKCDLICVM